MLAGQTFCVTSSRTLRPMVMPSSASIPSCVFATCIVHAIETARSRSRGPTAHPSDHFSTHLRVGPLRAGVSHDVRDALARLDHHAIGKFPLLGRRERTQGPFGNGVEQFDSTRVEDHAFSLRPGPEESHERAKFPPTFARGCLTPRTPHPPGRARGR